MDLITGIITSPRSVPTLPQAIASIRAAGFPAPVLSCDTARFGNIQNFLCLARMLLASDEDYILICEDDVTWIANAFDVVRTITRTLTRSRFGVLSLHCTRRVSRALEGKRLLDMTGGKLRAGVYESRLGIYTWGAQALLFTRDSLQVLVDSLVFCDYARTHRTGLDAAIFGTLKELELRAWYLLPCLARHDLGETNSGIVKGALHEARGCDY